jgi:hypothetical protein
MTARLSKAGELVPSSYGKYSSARQIGGLNSSEQLENFEFRSIGPALFD